MSIKQPIYIFGPCSAETREQVLATAKAIADRCAVRPLHCKTASAVRPAAPVGIIFRAGVWKPRTSPHTFQGIGAPALEWLREVRDTFGMEIATEVATPEHVEAALQAGVDYLWIGARTSANPLAVQEIANAIDRFAVRPAAPVGPLRCKTGDKSPVGILIKNPVNQDADLWLGNIERLERTGIPVAAVHRGCGHQPCWGMAHKVRLARPDIPMLLDPSHMSGDAKKVPELMGKIAELGLDGAMVEVHCKPSEALSDARQQISPDGLTAIRSDQDRFAVRPSQSDCKTGDKSPVGLELNWLRAEIDELDERLWETISARMDVSKRIGEWKKAHGVAALQPERYQEIVERIKDKGEWALRIWEQIHNESLRQQK